MQLSARLAKRDGVEQASVVMAAEGNLALLSEAGLLEGEVNASPSDLLVVVQGDDEQARLGQLTNWKMRWHAVQNQPTRAVRSRSGRIRFKWVCANNPAPTSC